MKNIVFDLGGVVLDWNPQRVKREYIGNPELPRDLFENDFFQNYWLEFDRGMVTEEEIIQQMSDFSGYSMEECRTFVEFIKHSLRDIPETVQLIKYLSGQGYKLYCLSNMSIEFYDYLKGREVFHYFDGQIISGLVKQVKPEKDIYLTLAERYGLSPQESLFIDDLQVNLETATDLGFHTVLFADREKGYAEIGNLLNIAINDPESLKR